MDFNINDSLKDLETGSKLVDNQKKILDSLLNKLPKEMTTKERDMISEGLSELDRVEGEANKALYNLKKMYAKK